jgi:uncharacterized protein
MLCPRCTVTLALGERHGIEIDYCPQCRGLWLDSGQVEKLIERNLGTVAPATPHATEGAFTASPWNTCSKNAFSSAGVSRFFGDAGRP